MVEVVVSRGACTPQLSSDGSKRILIVDDSELTINLLQSELAGKGLEVFAADSVERATSLLLKPATRPKLVLLDVNMPGVDGAQFCRFIKSNEMFSDIKVVFFSGIDPEQLEELTRASGADGCVHKDDYLGKWLTANCG